MAYISAKEEAAKRSLSAFIKSHKIPKPVQLELKLVAVRYDRNRNGRDARYFRAYIDGKTLRSG